MATKVVKAVSELIEDYHQIDYEIWKEKVAKNFPLIKKKLYTTSLYSEVYKQFGYNVYQELFLSNDKFKSDELNIKLYILQQIITPATINEFEKYAKEVKLTVEDINYNFLHEFFSSLLVGEDYTNRFIKVFKEAHFPNKELMKRVEELHYSVDSSNYKFMIELIGEPSQQIKDESLYNAIFSLRPGEIDFLINIGADLYSNRKKYPLLTRNMIPAQTPAGNHKSNQVECRNILHNYLKPVDLIKGNPFWNEYIDLYLSSKNQYTIALLGGLMHEGLVFPTKKEKYTQYAKALLTLDNESFVDIIKLYSEKGYINKSFENILLKETIKKYDYNKFSKLVEQGLGKAVFFETDTFKELSKDPKYQSFIQLAENFKTYKNLLKKTENKETTVVKSKKL